MSTTTQADAVKTAGLAVDDGRVDPVDEQLVRQLAERAQAEGVALTGPGGLLGRLTKVVLESALDGEMDAHLGYRKHDPAGQGSGNSRNGRRSKTVLTEAGPVELSVPRDRDASFEPVIRQLGSRPAAQGQCNCLEDLGESSGPSPIPRGSPRNCSANVFFAQVWLRQKNRRTCSWITVSWAATAVSASRRSYRLWTQRDTVPHAGHAASAVWVLAWIRTGRPARNTRSTRAPAR